MNQFIFGAKSKAPANTRLTNGYTLFDWVMRQNCFPAFWGRSISGRNQITTEELEFLSERDCKIALIFDDLTEIQVSSNNGEDDAMRAVERLKELGVPEDKGIAVFAEIKDDWSVNHNWMVTFALKLRENGYNPGFIGNTDSSLNFTFDRQFSHYINGGHNALCWATKPNVDGAIFKWEPYAPSSLMPDDVCFWQNETDEFNNVIYNTVYAKNSNILNYIWEYMGKDE